MRIPLVDLKIQYLSLKKQIDGAIQEVINDTAFIKGHYVEKFEDEYQEAYGVDHFISCANGTDAIYIALKALGIGLGDEVITVANTWISTAETISQTGAKPVFVDIDPDYYTIDTKQIVDKITPKTKAIIPVHLFGQACDMDEITRICSEYKLSLIEDCAQAHFAEWNGKRVGTFGDVGTFSFFPGKNLGAYGDAGGIVTDNTTLAQKMRAFANHGALNKHDHIMEGINSRLDGIQAAVLSVKLPYIHDWVIKRKACASYYNELFANQNNIITPKINELSSHVFHLYVIRVNNRDEIQSRLKLNGIGTGVHYPTPLPFMEAYQYLGHKPEDFPVSKKYMDRILSLPIYPELEKSQIKEIVDCIIQ